MNRIQVLNTDIDIEGFLSWRLLYLKEMDKVFFVIFEIPESSLASLKEHSIRVGSSIYLVLLRQFRSGRKEASNPEQKELSHNEGKATDSKGLEKLCMELDTGHADLAGSGIGSGVILGSG